jgi:hypothetical protein
LRAFGGGGAGDAGKSAWAGVCVHLPGAIVGGWPAGQWQLQPSLCPERCGVRWKPGWASSYQCYRWSEQRAFRDRARFWGWRAFDGSPRWLEISVRTNASAGPYTTLTPRQAITLAPYAAFASIAGSAALATSLLGGGALLTNVPASSLSGTVPLGRLSGITAAQLDAATWQTATSGVSSAALQGATNVIA